MRLTDALALRRRLAERTGQAYGVRRSAKRSLRVRPFYAHRKR